MSTNKKTLLKLQAHCFPEGHVLFTNPSFHNVFPHSQACSNENLNLEGSFIIHPFQFFTEM